MHAEPSTGYLASEGFVEPLLEELGDVAAVHGRLVLAPGPRRPAAWAADVWLEPVRLPVQSINDAARSLLARQRQWSLYSFHLHRRAQLIAAKLSPNATAPAAFPAPPPRQPVGSWTLLDEHTLLVSARCACPFPQGVVAFVENHTAPPSRAYLKLWELFSRLQVWPRAAERCLDLGASPGGWTWALQGLGARVLAVDKAPLEPRIASLPGVEYRAQSAFGLDPRAVEQVEWFFSDVICEPARLLQLVERWLDAGVCRNFICTVKFKGATDHPTARAFAAIPGSRLLHLHHNRHELTWFRLAPELMPRGDV